MLKMVGYTSMVLNPSNSTEHQFGTAGVEGAKLVIAIVFIIIDILITVTVLVSVHIYRNL